MSIVTSSFIAGNNFNIVLFIYLSAGFPYFPLNTKLTWSNPCTAATRAASLSSLTRETFTTLAPLIVGHSESRRRGTGRTGATGAGVVAVACPVADDDDGVGGITHTSSPSSDDTSLASQANARRSCAGLGGGGLGHGFVLSTVSNQASCLVLSNSACEQQLQKIIAHFMKKNKYYLTFLQPKLPRSHWRIPRTPFNAYPTLPKSTMIPYGDHPSGGTGVARHADACTQILFYPEHYLTPP